MMSLDHRPTPPLEGLPLQPHVADDLGHEQKTCCLRTC